MTHFIEVYKNQQPAFSELLQGIREDCQGNPRLHMAVLELVAVALELEMEAVEDQLV